MSTMGDNSRCHHCAVLRDYIAQLANENARLRAISEDLPPCTCPDGGIGPWEPEWDGEMDLDPGCHWHGGVRS